MKRFAASLFLICAFATVAFANPCFDPGAQVQSVAVAVSSATTTQLLPVVTNASYTLCGFSLSLTGTTPTAQFEYGTGTVCTGTHAITGAYAASTSIYGYIGEGLASNGICLVSGGTPTVQGELSYVIQAR